MCMDFTYCRSRAIDTTLLFTHADKSRLILLCWASGDQIANFYGAVNEDLSQPRHCWHPSGLYIYGVRKCFFYHNHSFLFASRKMFADYHLYPSFLNCLQTSEERCICIWEVRSQEMVAKLHGHTNVVVSCTMMLCLYSGMHSGMYY